MRMHRIHFVAALFVAILAGCASAPPPAPVKPAELVFPGPPDDPRFIYERTIYGSADVAAEEANSDLRRLVTGESRRSEVLGKPYAVAVHQGRVFVSDSAERFIKVFDFPRAKYYRIGEDDPGRIIKPLGIDVDRSGRLYVADATARDIKVFEADGRFVRAIGGTKWFDRLSSVTVDPAGERVYVVDIGGVSSQNHRVRIFNAKTGDHISDIGTRGSGPGEFNLPRDLAIGKDGLLYVVDGGNFRVQVFTPDGKYVKSFGSIGKQYGQFARPKEVATDKEGNVYVVDAAFGNFQIFSSEGDLLLFIGERSERDGPAKYMLPSGIYVDEDGRVYMVDQWFRKVDVYRPYRLKENQGFLASSNRTKAAKAK
ncbi:MAG: 6-bladed beta-propeller [Betaproteobacteria bacterium]